MKEKLKELFEDATAIGIGALGAWVICDTFERLFK